MKQFFQGIGGVIALLVAVPLFIMGACNPIGILLFVIIVVCVVFSNWKLY